MENKDLIIDFYDQICNIINNSKIPLVVEYYVIKDVFLQLEKIYQEYIQKYHTQQKQEKQKIETASATIDIPMEDIQNLISDD